MSNSKQNQRRDPCLFASTEALRSFAESVSSLWCPSSIEILTHLPSSTDFISQFVAKSRPCILRLDRNLPRWKVENIQEMCGKDAIITVNVTSDGHGDAIRSIKEDSNKIKKMFVLPEERRMSIEKFVQSLRNNPESHNLRIDSQFHMLELDILEMDDGKGGGQPRDKVATENKSSNGIFYYSLQNDCLRKELPPLVPYVDKHFQEILLWAETVFGTGQPDAVNLWVGPSRAVSSMHKDYYENLFFVSSGEKIFHLHPPCDAPFLPLKEIETCRFQQQGDHTWKVVREENIDNPHVPFKTPWIDLWGTDKYDSYRHPITVSVRAGDILYLPSLWFHQVSQTCETVAINWWFDMQFDSPLYCYFDLLQNCRVQCQDDEEK